MNSRPLAIPRAEPSFAELFTPKLITVLREGYSAAKLRADALAGLTVAVVALPLSMAIAIASGAPPERGLYTAIVGGFLISLLGGSRVQIGGPAGAFIVLVAAIVERFGLDGLMTATLMAGVMLIGIGTLRLGTYIRYIPHPVIVGFTTGIAVIIGASQLRDLLGLTIVGREPAAFLPKLQTLATATSVNFYALAISAAVVALIVGLRRWRPHWPGFLIAIVAAAAVTWLLNLPVETIATRFGEIPRVLPAPATPNLSWDRMMEMFPYAVAIALLGGIESLLSAVVADGMTGRRHRSNCELAAQGVANIAASLFGGLCATGTIARTATNVRAGAVGPIAGMLHSVFLLLMMLVAAPLMGAIPLAALAAILAVVAWNMAERHAFLAILKTSRGDGAVLLATFLLTVFRDLTEGIAVGVVMGSLLFMHRMASLVAVEAHAPLNIEDRADNGSEAGRDEQQREDVVVFRIAGPLFFGAAATLSNVLERTGWTPRRYILDLSAAPFLDETAAAAINAFADRAMRAGATVCIAAASDKVRRALLDVGLDARATFAASVADAR